MTASVVKEPKPYQVRCVTSAVSDVVFAVDRYDARRRAERLAADLEDKVLDCRRVYPQRRNAATTAALMGSIKKWEGIVAVERRDRGVADCALCQMFHDPRGAYAKFCVGCPVAAFTGRHGCLQTAYGAFSVSSDSYSYAVIETAQLHARRMLNLLKGLLAPEPAAKKKKKAT